MRTKPEGTFKCRLCPKRFDRIFGMAQHWDKTHGMELRIQITDCSTEELNKIGVQDINVVTQRIYIGKIRARLVVLP